MHGKNIGLFVPALSQNSSGGRESGKKRLWPPKDPIYPKTSESTASSSGGSHTLLLNQGEIVRCCWIPPVCFSPLCLSWVAMGSASAVACGDWDLCCHHHCLLHIDLLVLWWVRTAVPPGSSVACELFYFKVLPAIIPKDICAAGLAMRGHGPANWVPLRGQPPKNIPS